jgi:hypothetical protein
MNKWSEARLVEMLLQEYGGEPQFEVELNNVPEMELVIRALEAKGYTVSRSDFKARVVAVRP